MAIDTGKISMLIMLDLSTVFEAADHKMLLGCLHGIAGVDGSAVQWLQSPAKLTGW